MSGNPRTVAVNTTFMWDGAPQYLHRGRVLDVVPGSALEQAIGADRLVPLRRSAPLPPPVEPAEQASPVEAVEPAPAPVKARAAARKAGDAKDGAS